MPRVAVMQPYLFPYIGYMNLAHAADCFVFYDDVSYIKQGWINRNRILIGGKEHIFAIPVKGQSSNKLINQIYVQDYTRFCIKFEKKLRESYAKANFFDQGMAYVESVTQMECELIADFAVNSVRNFFYFLNMDKSFIRSSELNLTAERMCRTERLISITKTLKGDKYINMEGGRNLYEAADFSSASLTLSFLAPKVRPYRQYGASAFLPNLSIIDALMNCDLSDVRRQLESYDIHHA